MFAANRVRPRGTCRDQYVVEMLPSAPRPGPCDRQALTPDRIRWAFRGALGLSVKANREVPPSAPCRSVQHWIHWCAMDPDRPAGPGSREAEREDPRGREPARPERRHTRGPRHAAGTALPGGDGRRSHRPRREAAGCSGSLRGGCKRVEERRPQHYRLRAPFGHFTCRCHSQGHARLSYGP